MQSHEDEVTRQAFGRVIRALRHEVGISQEELADRAGLHRTYISMVERGIKTPTVVTLVELARAVGMQTGELMTLFDHELAAGATTTKDAARARRHTSRGKAISL